MAYIYPAPGVAAKQAILKIKDLNEVTSPTTTNERMVVPAMQDITMNGAKDVFSWTQLDATAKKQIATTSTNSISGNIVVDTATFFGDAAGNGIDTVGLNGAQTQSILIAFEIYTGDTSDGAEGRFISGQGYITGLSPTVSADSPVWVSPFTITVDGEYTVETTEQLDDALV